MGIDLSKALDGIPVVATSTDRDTRYPTPSTNQRVYRLDSGTVELWNGSAWTTILQGYSEGSWTPAFAGTTVAGTYTYTTQVGRYIKVGNLVTCWAFVNASATTVAPTGTAFTVTGLPFAGSNVTGLNQAVVISEVDNITLGSGYTEFVGYVSPNTTTITLRKNGSNVSAALVAPADVGSAPAIIFSVTYRTA